MEHKVTLVGAGPGDPGLLTLKALRAIEAAEVVVYDRLVSEEVMALVPRGVPKIYAGKSCKHKAMPQKEINALLVMLAGKYARVVRLKGGDPFMFGRGGEEMLALAAHHIPCEIIPGITSAQGCAAAAGIPLTHRGLASGVRFITGHHSSPSRGEAGRGASSAHTYPHPNIRENALFENTEAVLESVYNKIRTKQECPHPNPPPTGEGIELNWPSLADPDTTLVVYMGLVNIVDIVRNLQENGLAANTPAAIIERGTTPQQRVFATTLAGLVTQVKAENIQSPSLVIIGKVASFAAQKARETAIFNDFLAHTAQS